VLLIVFENVIPGQFLALFAAFFIDFSSFCDNNLHLFCFSANAYRKENKYIKCVACLDTNCKHLSYDVNS